MVPPEIKGPTRPPSAPPSPPLSPPPASSSAAPPDATIGLLISDVDGTLVTPDKQITPATTAALARLHAAGIRFTLVSSRPPRAMRQLLQRLNVDTFSAGYNGGAIVDAQGQVVESHCLRAEDARAAIAALQREPVETWVFSGDLWLVRDPQGAYVAHEHHTLGYDCTLVDSFEPYIDRVQKIVAASSDAAVLARLQAALNPRLAPHAQAALSQAYYLDVTHARANKGDAVAALARHIGVPLQQTAVIGDGANDIPMFQRAGLAIAMGQAAPDVRAQATHVTASNKEDGLAAAIINYLLPGAANV